MLALIVDDNKALLVLQQLLLQEVGLMVMTAWNAEEALSIAKRQRFDLAVVDYHLPTMNGAQLARELKRTNPGVRVLLMSGSGEVPLTDLEAADEFLVKGQHATSEFVNTVRRLIARSA
jgi:two-component system OmpR family response regulator